MLEQGNDGAAATGLQRVIEGFCVQLLAPAADGRLPFVGRLLHLIRVRVRVRTGVGMFRVKRPSCTSHRHGYADQAIVPIRAINDKCLMHVVSLRHASAVNLFDWPCSCQSSS